MMPIFSPGDRVIVSSLPYWFFSPKIGDTVLFRYENKYMIKRISMIDGKWYMVKGENKNDSLKVPKIKKEDIVGKVIFKI